MWISRDQYEALLKEAAYAKQREAEALHKLHQSTEVVYMLKRRLQSREDRIAWLIKHFPTAAHCLVFVYSIDGVTFKSTHMSVSIPAGKQVTLTIKGLGVDSTGATVEAPITQIAVTASNATALGVSQNADGTFTLKYLSDGIGSLSATAVNSLGSSLSGSDDYTTGGTVPPPVVASSLSFNYGAPTDIVV